MYKIMLTNLNWECKKLGLIKKTENLFYIPKNPYITAFISGSNEISYTINKDGKIKEYKHLKRFVNALKKLLN